MKKSHIVIIASVLIGCIFTCAILIDILSPNSPFCKKEGQLSALTIDGTALYMDAISGLEESDLQLTIQENRTITTADSSYRVERNKTVSYDRSDPNDQRYSMEETVTMGSHQFTTAEYHADGKVYALVSGLAFRIDNDDSYLFSLPAAALDPTRYNKITATPTEEGYLIDFSDPTRPEAWLNVAGGRWEVTQASALLSKDKQPLSYTYTASHRQDSAHIAVTCQVFVTGTDVEVTLPEPENGWLTLDKPYAPMLLEAAAGILLQSETVASDYHENIYFEALGDRRVRDIQLRLESIDPLSAQFTTKTTTSKDSRLDQPEVTTKEETFAEGKYTLRQNDSDTVTDPSVNDEAMLRYLQNQLISTIMLPEYISNCTLETTGDIIHYTFTGNAAFAEFLCRNAGQQLYGDPELFMGETAAVSTEQLICYLDINNATGLPSASGIQFSGSYENLSVPYHFTYEVSQNYNYKTE